MRRKTVDDFWDSVNIDSGTNCWEWTGPVMSGTGYGNAHINGRAVSPHRYVYESYYGAIPSGKLVCHECDNRLCCNPSHLFLGSHKDNTRDAISKDRLAKGERHGRAKLKESDILSIRDIWNNGNYGEREIGEMFGITQSMVSMIIHKRKWGWL